jgi:N-acetylglucosamine kinase-like BadF-type ATPase
MAGRLDKKEYILGVDGGGTKTVVQIADLSGRKITQAVSGASNCNSVGMAKAIENLNAGILTAIKNLNRQNRIYFRSSCLGFAGNNTEKDEKIYRQIVFNRQINKYLNPDKTIICNDTRIGLAAGSDNENKIILICGTGSNCYGVNEAGEEAIASGWDYILADEGSGYEIGIKALRAFMRAYDGRGIKTFLSKTIMQDLNLKNELDLTKWAYDNPLSKDKISSLAKTVCKTAEMGDIVSIKILSEEAHEAAISVTAVADKLGFKNKQFDLVLVGSVFKCEKYFKNVLMEKLKREFAKINFITLTRSPVEGAIRLAIDNL